MDERRVGSFFFVSLGPHKDFSARGMPDRFGRLTERAGEFNACRYLPPSVLSQRGGQRPPTNQQMALHPLRPWRRTPPEFSSQLECKKGLHMPRLFL